jgi:CHRD domain
MSYDNLTKDHLRNGTRLSPKFLALVIAIPMIVGASNETSAIQPTFVAGLTGNQEVPVVHTNATGTASFLAASNSTTGYVLNVTGMSNVTQADVNVAEQGKNGPIILTLFTSKDPVSNFTGVLSQGNITSANLQGPMKGKQLASLTDLMQNGTAYVNIRTVQNPNGEIRGQIGLAGIDESGTALGEKNLTLSDESLQFE